jgi:hypothetical protein
MEEVAIPTTFVSLDKHNLNILLKRIEESGRFFDQVLYPFPNNSTAAIWCVLSFC